MDRRLTEAAKKGEVDKLHNLIKDDPLVLRAVALDYGETPLNISCTGGHVNFVKELLNLRPEFAQELNQDGFSPLHIASANGDIEIVKELLKVGSHLCLVQGKEKRIPFHCAVAKGRIEVIRELLSACQDSITEVTVRGETCFHLAVKNNQFKAFKVLCEHVVTFDKEDILNHKDEQGNDILHLAASRKQYEVVDLLLDKNFGYKGNLEVNHLNKKGLTPLDVLVSEGGDCEIEEMFTLAGAVTGAISAQNSVVAIQDPSQDQSGQEQRRDRPKSIYQKLQEFFIFECSTGLSSEAQNSMLGMAALVATATYSAMLCPPGGVWQDDFWPDANCTNTGMRNDSSTEQSPPHSAGKAVMATKIPEIFCLYIVFNTLGFTTSLHMMRLSVGFHRQFELSAVVHALILTYSACFVAITTTAVSIGVISVLTLILMMMKLTRVVRHYRKGRRPSLPSTRASA